MKKLLNNPIATAVAGFVLGLFWYQITAYVQGVI